MLDYNYWNSLFSNNRYPCFIRNIENEQIVYANKEFYKAFNCDEQIIGKNFQEVVKIDDESYQNIQNNILAKSNHEFGFYHKNSNQNYRGFSSLIRDNLHLMCEFKINLDEDRSLEKAMTRCIDIYQQPEETVLTSLMELICDFYNAERAYVYRFDKESSTINCICEWFLDTSLALPQSSDSKINSASLLKWLESESKDGIVMANKEDIELDNSSSVSALLDTFKIQNLSLCTIEDANHNIVGLVGMSNRKDVSSFFDKRLLNTISRFIAQDITKGAIDATIFQLHHKDSLTGLYNRIGYSKKVDDILESNPKSMGIISANINGLKFINEVSGISGGDEHIKKSARLLKEHFGYEFFRMSGDEFLGVAPNVSKEDFEAKVIGLHAIMKSSGNYDFSIGHSWARGNLDLSKLIFEAETVMYINKQEYYSNSDRKFDSVTDTTLSDLLSYLENDEFMIYLQPQVRLKDASLHGAEALIRRFDKTNQKMVFPDQFISLYEQKSVIRHVDMFVIHSVCKLLSKWAKTGEAIPISVNLSRVTLQEYGIVDTIVQICDKYHVPHNLLVIEVTERVGLIENNVASSLITSFKKHGFHISLDDFGCAYSNIVTLAQIEVDEVKIDKSLVDDLTTSKKNHILVKNVLTMCNELDGASTLAEGIEDENQAKLLYELGCNLGQGYFYSRPVPVTDFCDKYMN